MPPRVPTPIENVIFADKLKAEEITEQEKLTANLHSGAITFIENHLSSGRTGRPSDEGYTLTRESSLKKYRTRTLGGYLVEQSFKAWQEAIAASIDAAEDKYEFWRSKPVQIDLHLSSRSELVSGATLSCYETFPAMRFFEHEVKWAEINEAGEVGWKEVDVLRDEDRMGIIIDTLHFLNGRN